MKYSDVSAKSAEQLQAQLIELRKEQMNLRFAKSAGQMEKPTRWREVRKAIARVHTAIKAATGKKEA
ncbi:MAG: 50S ribosomal protein L29 [Pseudomonadaceae bacterium]|nr:50S ribosomal protein L29 [Pseudomonadaceae bacterium]